jgi:hypothetical protein
LRDLTDADQRVRPGPQHQPLQVPDRGQVPILNCLEYPAPQPPYSLLMSSPVHPFPGVTVEDGARARRSIHRSVQLIPWLWQLLLLRFKGPPAHVSTPFRAGHQARYPASYPPTIREEFPVLRSAVSCCVSAAGIRFLGTLSCQTGFRPPYDRPTTAGAHTRAPATDPGRVYTLHTRETRTGPGALFTPGTTVFAGHRWIRGRRLPPLNGWSLPPRHSCPTRDVDVTRHQQEFPGSRPSGPSPHL